MPQTQLGGVVQHIRKLLDTASGRELDDAQVLHRFVTDRDETAFATLVKRHGKLVWSVCWQVLHHEQDVEDAFQATFLVLARQASSIRPCPRADNFRECRLCYRGAFLEMKRALTVMAI